MPRTSFIHPGTTFTFAPPFDGPLTFLLHGAAGAGAERSAGTTGHSHVATASETFTVPSGAFNVVVTAEGKGGAGGGGDGPLGGGGGGGGGKGVRNLGTFSGAIVITISGGDAVSDAGAEGYHGTNGGSVTAGTGGGWAGDSGTNGNNGTAGGSPGPDANGGAGGNSGAGSAGGAGGAGGHPVAANGSPGNNFGGGGGGGGGTTVPGTNGTGGVGGDAAVTVTWDSKAGGGGGGGGAVAIVTINPATAGHAYNLEIPAGGTVGGSTAADCRVLDGASVIGKAKPGLNATTKTGATGGAAASCIGDTTRSGGNGGNSDDDKAGGGGAGCAGDLAAGSNGSAGGSTTGGAGGAGGSTDGGAGGKGGDIGGVAVAGNKPGGGGGGAPADTDTAAKEGADGRIDVDWYLPPEWFDTGCWCCEVGLPDTFDLYCSGFNLPTGRVGHPEEDPCGPGVHTVAPFMIPNGWTKVYNETVYPFNEWGVGTPIVVPVAWKSARMGPWCNGGCYLTLWVWCDRDGEHPFGTAPGGTLYVAPGSWFTMHKFEPCQDIFGDPAYAWPASSFATVSAGNWIDNTENWPCDYACTAAAADGRFKVPYTGGGVAGAQLLQGIAIFYGIPPGAAMC